MTTKPLAIRTGKVAEYLLDDSGALQPDSLNALNALAGKTADPQPQATIAPQGGPAMISLATSGVAYTQNFDTLANTGTSSTLPTDWFLSETGTAANTTYTAGTGSLTTGDTYSFGAAASTERALGTLLSGSLVSTIGATFTNNTGGTITSLLISYIGEQWRLGATGRTDRLDFQISFDATSLTTGSWSNVDTLDFTAPVSAGTVGLLDGNAAANRTAVSATISSLTVANGATFWIRWVDLNATGSDDGLAVDDFSLTPTATAPPPETQTVVFNPLSVTLAEGNAGATLYSFTVTRTGGTTGILDFSGTIAPGSTDGADFTGGTAPTTFSGAIAAGQASATVTVSVNGDVTIESNESFQLTLTSVSNQSAIPSSIGAGATATGNITNDDVAGTLAINDVSHAEGDAGATNYTFTVTRSGGTTGTVGATWTINAPGGAGLADSGDFVAGSVFTGTVSFADGETSKTISIDVQGDDTVETDETFTVDLTLPTGGATFTDAQGLGTITNDDNAGSLSIGDVSLAEGNAATTAFSFTVTRSGGDDGAVSATWTINLPGGVGGADASDLASGHLLTGSVAFADGETSKTIIVDVSGDTDFEPDEAFTVTLSAPLGGVAIGDAIGDGLIQNDDAAPAGTFNIDDVSHSEGDSGATTYTFTVSRDGGSNGAVTVDYAIPTPGGAGLADSGDFVAGSVFAGTLSFANGETSKTITIDVQGDADFEASETFAVNLSNATGGTAIGDGAGAGTIVNDDPQPPAGSVSIADAAIVEGNAGTSLLVLTLTRTGGTGAFAVDFATANGGNPNNASAAAGSDYVAQSGTVNFGAGENSKTVSITINGDTVFELSEEFRVALSNATNGASISDATAIATITNDDSAPTILRIFDEDFTGFTAAGFAPNPTAAQVDSDIWRVVGLSDIANPAYGFTATTGDFARGIITGGADPTTAGVYSHSAMAAMILQPTGAELDIAGFIEARIQNTSGSTATGFNVAFDWVYRNSADRADNMQLSYSTDGTNFITVPAADFSTPSIKEVSTPTTFSTFHEAVSLTGLSVADQGFIYFRWTHLNSTGSNSRDEVGIDNVTVDATGLAATGPTVSVSDVSVNEAAGTMTFTITRSNLVSGAFTVQYATADGTAIAGQDYDATSGTLSFTDNQVQASVTVTITDDGIAEFDDTILLNLSNATGGAAIADGQGVGTIVNDDGAPISVSINDVTIAEGNAGTSIATFTVTRSGGTGAFNINFTTADQSAVAPGDYLSNSGTLNFGVGENSKTISVTINGDTATEQTETFRVELSGATNNALFADAIGIGTITTDDAIFIHDIQGNSYFSPILAAENITTFNTASATVVLVRAIVTAVDNDGPRQGFYITEELTDWDGNSFTSEGIFVMTRNDASVGSVVSGVAVGDLVQFSAQVMEYQSFSTLPRTMLVNHTGLLTISSGNALPTPVVLTNIPNEVLTGVAPDFLDSSDGVGDTFDASLYALSYWETVEGMMVTIPNMVAADGFVSTSGGRPFLQAYSLDSANADQINSRGGYTIAGDPPIGPPDTAGTGDNTIRDGRHLHDGDVNPDIIELDFTGWAMAPPTGLAQNATMGDLLGDVTGIVDFDFTDRKLFVTAMEPGGFVNGGIPTQEITVLGDDSRSLTVATFNVENLDPSDGAARFTALANAIANNLNAPDIISIEEMQDNNGALAGDGITATGTDASTTWQMLVDALNIVTGAHYQWVDQAPTYNAEGGEQSGNIRVGFLYNTDRVQLGDLDANATLAERRMYTDRIGDGTRDAGDLIAYSDDMLGGEINTADWSTTRRSLLGEFTFNGNKVYVVANHWPSKGGSGEIWQFNQNIDAGQPANSDWAQRNEVGQDVYSMMNLIAAGSPDAGIASGGDYNDFYFYRPLTTVTGYTLANGTARVGGTRFENLTLTLAEAERYTYAFDGRSQAIDHIIVNPLLGGVATYDVVHINTGYNPAGTGPDANPALSDHDPALSSFDYRNFSEVLVGTSGNDVIDGFGGNDRISTGLGNDFLDGNVGIDRLIGGGGNDVYVVDNASDEVIEAAGDSRDVVYAAASYGLAAGAEIEVLSAKDQSGAAALVLIGNGFGQEIYGNAGANFLEGAGGTDYLIGLGGNDTYVVDGSEDAVVEAIGGGTDVVYARGDYTLTAGAEVEVISTISQDATASVALIGNGFGQTIYGNAGANFLEGGGGADVLIGLAGNDVYVVDSASDYVAESGGGGRDVVYARASFALGSGQEVEVLSTASQAATTAIDLTGNELGNEILGNAGANVLNGGAGGDFLFGLGGADTFAFTTALGGGNVDHVGDFLALDDTVALDHNVFTGLGVGALGANAFALGTAAGDADDRIIYDQASGRLWFDADGNGAGAQVLFAVLDGGPVITASDFTVI
jgi:predicted extracellular nuclease